MSRKLSVETLCEINALYYATTQNVLNISWSSGTRLCRRGETDPSLRQSVSLSLARWSKHEHVQIEK